MKISIIFSSVLLFASFQLDATPAEHNTWAMYQGNAQHTGYVPITIKAKQIKRTWQSYVGKPSSVNYKINQAIIGDNAVYVSRNNYVYSNTLQAFSIDTGNTLWTSEFGDLQVQAPSYHKDKIFIQTLGYASREKGGLLALNEKGKLLFKTTVSDSPNSVGAPIINNGIIYTVNNDGSVISYSENNGNKLKEYIGYGSDYGTHSPAIINNFLINYQDNSVYVFDVSSAQLLVQIPLEEENNFSNNATPVISDNDSLLIYKNAELTKINIEKQEIEYIIHHVNALPAVDDENIYTVKNNRLTAINKLSGKTKWVSHDVDFSNGVQNIIVTNNLVFVSGKYSTSAISKDSHHRLWTTSVHGEMSLSKQGLIIVSPAGQLTRFSIVTNDESDEHTDQVPLIN